MPYIKLPNGVFCEIPEGMDPDLAMARAEDQFPDAFAPPEGGFMAALKSGTRGLKGAGYAGAAGLGLMPVAEAEAARAQLEQEDKAKYKSASKGWSETPWEEFKELAGQSIPYMAAPLAVGTAATVAGAPALAATGLAGLASAAQFTATNADRQIKDGGKDLANVDWESAALAAIPQAALDMVGFKMMPGVRRLLGSVGKEVSEEAAARIAKQNLKQVAADYAASTGKAMGAEGLTEAAQQVLERMQAGLNLTDDKAREEYIQSLIGGAVLGGAISPAGRYVERSGEQNRQETKIRVDEAAANAKVLEEADAERQKKLADPEYITNLHKQSYEYAKQFKKLQDAANAKVEETDFAGQATKKAAQEAFKAFTSSAEFQQHRADLQAAAPKIKELEEQAKVAKEQEAAAAKAQEDAAAAEAARPRTPQEMAQLRTQLFDAQEGLNAATAAAKEAARSGDKAAYAAAQTAIAEHKTAVAKLSAAVPAPVPTPPIPVYPELAALKRKLQQRLKAHDSALATDPEAAASIFEEIQGLQADIATAMETSSAMQQRTQDLRTQQPTPEAPNPYADFPATPEERQQALRRAPQPPSDLLPVEEQSGTAPLFKSPASAGGNSQVYSNVGEAPSRVKLMADAAIARATGNHAKAEEIKQQLSDMSNRERQRGSESSGYDAARVSSALGIELPKTASDLSKHSDAVDVAYAKMVALLDKSNRGRLHQDELYAARDVVVNRMIADVAARQGGITAEQRSNIRNQTNAILRELINRFGDTRNIVVEKDGRATDVQNTDGTYKDDLLDDGQFGRINEESAAPGRQTFGSPHAAVEALRGQLTDIRNDMLKGPEPKAPLTPAETRAQQMEARIGAGDITTTNTSLAATRAPLTPRHETREQRGPDAARMQAIRDNMDVIAGDVERSNTVHDWLDQQDRPSSQRALDDMLRTLEEAKRSETEGGRTAAQGDLLDDVPMRDQVGTTQEGFTRNIPDPEDTLPVTRGKVFATPEKLVAHLESAELQRLRERIGLQIPTVQRILKMMEPLQKKLNTLHMELEQLSMQQAGITDLPQRKTRMYEQLMELQREVITHTEELIKQEQLIKDASDMAAEASYAIAENDPAAKLSAEVKAANQAVVDAQVALDKARDVYLTADKGMPETKEQARARDSARIAKENWQHAENEANRLSYVPEMQPGETAAGHTRRTEALRVANERDFPGVPGAKIERVGFDAPTGAETELQYRARVNEQRAAYEKAKAHAEFLRKHMARMQGQYTRKMQDPTRIMEHSNRWQLSLLALKDATGVLQRALRRQATVHGKTENAVLSSDKAINEWAIKHDKLQAVLLQATETQARAERARVAAQASIDAIRKIQEEVVVGETNRGTTPVDAENARRGAERDALAAEARAKQEEASTTKKELGTLEKQNTPEARAAEAEQRAEDLRRSEQATQENQTVREKRDRAQRKAENELAERLANMPGEEIRHEAFREAQALVGDSNEYAATVAKLEAKKTEAGVSDDTKKKVDRALVQLRRYKKYIDGAAEGNQGTRLQAEVELTKLTAPWTSQKGVKREGRIPELKRQLEEAEAAGATNKQLGNIRKELTKANKHARELRQILKAYNARAVRETNTEKLARVEAAKEFLRQQQRDTFEERGTAQGDAPVRGADGKLVQESDLPALTRGRVSQASKKELLAGDQRTGTEESKGLPDENGERGTGENKISNRNPVLEQRRVVESNRAISKKEMEEANAAAAAMRPGVSTPVSDPVAQEIDAKRDADARDAQDAQIAKIEKQLGAAETRIVEAEDAAIPVPYEQMTRLLAREAELQKDLAHAKAMRAMLERRNPNKEKPTEPRAPQEDARAMLDAAYDAEIESYDNQPADLFVGEAEASDIDSPVLFRSDATGKRGMDIADVETSVADTLGKWDNVPEVKYVQTEAELPLRLQGAITKANKNGNVPGMFDAKSGKVWLIGDNIVSAKEAVLTVLHEVAGHYGLRDMLGKDYESTMQRLYNGNAEIKRLADAKLATDSTLTQDVAVEEVLAEAAEKNPKSSIVQRAIYALKTLLHKLFGYKNVSDADVLQLVANARRHVETGTPGPKGGKSNDTVLRTAPDYGAYSNSALANLNTGSQDTRGWYQRWTENLGLSLETGIVDMHAPIFRALDRMGKTHDVMQAKYALREAGAITGWIQSFLSYGAPELHTDSKGYHGIRASKGTSGMDVLRAAEGIPGGNTEGKFQMATRYMLMKRGSRVGASKLGVDAQGKPITQASLDAIRREVDADPKLKASLEHFQSVYNKYNEKLVNFARDTGGITADKAREFLQHKDYVPMYRVRDGQLELSFGDDAYVKMGDVANTPFIHALKGDDTAIMPINESIIYNTKLMVEVGMTNLAKRNIGYVLHAAGKGSTPGSAGKMPVRFGMAPAGKEYLQWQEEPYYGETGEHAGMRYVKIDTDGTAMEGLPPQVLGKSIEGFHATMPAFVRWASKLNDLLRAGVTRMPPYTLRQLVKDPASAASTTGLASNPLSTIGKAMREYGKGMFGDKTALEEANRHALVQSNVFTGDIDDMLVMTHQIANGNNPNLVRKFLNELDRSAQTADAATRITVYKDAIARGLSEVEAAYRTRESMNYHKRGGWATMQYANRMLPFFNSGVQAINVAVKALQGKMPFEEELKVRQTYVRNALMIAIGGMTYAALMQDNDEYKKLKPADRYGNFHVNLPGTDLMLKIPVMYAESGGMAWALGLALVDSLGDTVNGKQIIKGLAAYGQTAVPGGGTLPLPTGLKQATEWLTNTDLRTYRPIVGRALQGLTKDQQFTDSTPESFKALGALGISPIQFQHAIDGITGSAATSVLNILEKTLGIGDSSTVAKPSLTLDKIPLVKSFIQNPKSSADVDAVYDFAEKAKAAHSTFNDMKRKGRSAADIKEYLEEHRAEIGMAQMAGHFTQQMGKLNTDASIINNAPRSQYSPERKTEALTRINKMKQDLAARYMQAVKRAEVTARANTA